MRSFDYDGIHLVLHLDRAVHAEWVEAFHSIGGHSYYSDGTEKPVTFSYSGDSVRVPVGPKEAQQVVDWFKSYLPKATQIYKGKVVAEQGRREEEQRQELRRKRELEERRNEVLKKLQI